MSRKKMLLVNGKPYHSLKSFCLSVGLKKGFKYQTLRTYWSRFGVNKKLNYKGYTFERQLIK